MISYGRRFARTTFALVAGLASMAVTGCGIQSTTSPDPTLVKIGSISGSVHGGQQPVSGSHVYLLQATVSGNSTSGYGNNANPILTTTGGYVITTSGGAFSITGDYSCSPNSLVYLLALSGNPGLAAGTNNGQIALMTGLGPCSALTANTQVSINEVSTVVTAYALAGFMSANNQLSTSTNNLPGLTRAFANINNMVNIANDVAYTTTPGGNGIVPQAEINTLANIIANCVNSPGFTAPCNNLFAATTVGSSTPNDTVQALLNIAHNPAANVAAIFSQSTANAPFQPSLTQAPNDFTLALSYTGTSIGQSFGMAVDGSGNAWVTNVNNANVTELSPLGTVLATYTTGSRPNGVAIDSNGIVYTANYDSNSVTKIAGGVVTSITSGIGSNPFDVALDGNNSLYVANFGSSNISTIVAGNTTGVATASGAGGVSNPKSIAVDGFGAIWTANTTNNSVSKLQGGTFTSGTNGFTGNGLNAPQSIAFDNNSNLWLANQTSTVSRFDVNGGAISGSPYSGGGSQIQYGTAIDGNGNVFISDNNQLKELTQTGTAVTTATGFTAPSLSTALRLSADQSGDLWVSNNVSSNQYVTEFIGLAAPTAAPLAYSVGNGFLAKKP